MNDIDVRLARVLQDAVPEPPHELDPSAIRASARRHSHRKRLLAPAFAAAAVAAVAIGLSLAAHQLVTRHRPGPGGLAAVPSPPARFTANEFRMAPPPQLVVGPVPILRATCKPPQISAIAATRRTPGGVLGVIHLVGTIVTHRYGVAERCALPIARGPSALIGADSLPLKVPLSGGDRTSLPANPRPDISLIDGNAIWGFAWLGSWCGARAGAIELPLGHPRGASLRVPLRGPQPHCEPAAGASTLIDGIAGAPGEPVQPPRPDYSSLRLSAQIEPGTTSDQLAPIDLTLRNIGGAAVALDPCPAYAGEEQGTARSGGFGGPISSGYLPCTEHAIVIRPGYPVHLTIPASSFQQSGPGSGAIPGTTVYVDLGIAGVPQLHLTTTVSR